MNVLTASLIAFEKQQWRVPGSKDQAIHDLFGVSATRYHLAVNRVIDDPEALALDPVTVNRLRRLRDSRRQARAS
jgi:hypothetical protein